MNYRPLSVIVLAVVLVLAGCSGLVPGGDSAGNGTATAGPTATAGSAATDAPMGTPASTMTPTPTESTTTAMETARTTAPATTGGTATPARTTTGNGTQSASFPPGYAASGITNPQRALERHRTALSSRDSFTVTLNLNTTRRQITAIRRINTANERAYTTVNASASGSSLGVGIASYQTGNTRYTRTSFANQSRYNVTTQPFAVGGTNRSLGRATVLGNVSYGDAERVTRNGETLFRYESSDLRNARAFLPITATNATVEDFNATVLVGTDGIIRSFSYSITYTTTDGERRTNTVAVRLSRIGATSVEEPAWLDEARAQTNPSATGNTTTSS